jgi:transposase-like protein
MTTDQRPPDLEHAKWCERPPLRRSDLPLDRNHVRWRCPSCGRTVYTSRSAS